MCIRTNSCILPILISPLWFIVVITFGLILWKFKCMYFMIEPCALKVWVCQIDKNIGTFFPGAPECDYFCLSCCKS